MGGPVDSLRVLAPQVGRALESSVDPEVRARATEMWLHLPILVGFPAFQFPEVEQLAGAGTGLLNADAAYLRGDSTAARRALAPIPRHEASRSAGRSDHRPRLWHGVVDGRAG